ncbi:MAG: hypothetical protein Hyperionvirus2_177 [Hyperionvirus sp.]|uniref:Uncharacterized protein n=1 Tax=Hyperionvirus sp. TaxID=2487770 RepID=A0A3G5ABZ5_9VIRU|nr:MAG: hypothetical protein Hyperionvirus2_177 [Hyperionvirus sp.]
MAAAAVSGSKRMTTSVEVKAGALGAAIGGIIAAKVAALKGPVAAAVSKDNMASFVSETAAVFADLKKARAAMGFVEESPAEEKRSDAALAKLGAWEKIARARALAPPKSWIQTEMRPIVMVTNFDEIPHIIRNHFSDLIDSDLDDEAELDRECFRSVFFVCEIDFTSFTQTVFDILRNLKYLSEKGAKIEIVTRIENPRFIENVLSWAGFKHNRPVLFVPPDVPLGPFIHKDNERLNGGALFILHHRDEELNSFAGPTLYRPAGRVLRLKYAHT